MIVNFQDPFLQPLLEAIARSTGAIVLEIKIIVTPGITLGRRRMESATRARSPWRDAPSSTSRAMASWSERNLSIAFCIQSVARLSSARLARSHAAKGLANPSFVAEERSCRRELERSPPMFTRGDRSRKEPGCLIVANPVNGQEKRYFFISSILSIFIFSALVFVLLF